MSSKEIRKIILTLAVMAIGVKILAIISGGFTPKTALPGISGISAGFQNMADTIIIFAVVAIIILIPFYLSRRSSEKKQNKIENYAE